MVTITVCDEQIFNGDEKETLQCFNYLWLVACVCVVLIKTCENAFICSYSLRLWRVKDSSQLCSLKLLNFNERKRICESLLIIYILCLSASGVVSDSKYLWNFVSPVWSNRLEFVTCDRNNFLKLSRPLLQLKDLINSLYLCSE